MNSVWDSTISERLNNGTSVIDELFKCIGDYNADCALRLLHPSRFDGKDIAFELREGFSWCKDNVQSFCQQVIDYPLKSRVQDLFRMITILMRDYDKQLAHDDIDPKGQIWYCMNLVYQFGQELLSQRGLNVPPNVQGISYRSNKTDKTLPEPSPSPSVQATAKDDAAKNISITKINADRLGSFFIAKFKGSGNNYNHFDDMIKDIQAIKATKELAMIAVMIYDCRRYFIQRPSTFAAWLREFFEMIGRDCPKDCHKNKYRPNEQIKRTFYYLA